MLKQCFVAIHDSRKDPTQRWFSVRFFGHASEIHVLVSICTSNWKSVQSFRCYLLTYTAIAIHMQLITIPTHALRNTIIRYALVFTLETIPTHGLSWLHWRWGLGTTWRSRSASWKGHKQRIRKQIHNWIINEKASRKKSRNAMTSSWLK